MPGGRGRSRRANVLKEKDFACRSRTAGIRLPDVRGKWQPQLRAEQHHLRNCQRLRVSYRQKRAAGVHSLETARRAAVKPQLRRATGANDLDITPEDALRVPRSERFHRRLFGGKTAGEVR